MQNSKGLVLFALLVTCATAFVWFTSIRLPALVASHFGGSGAADGFMPHGYYVRFMLAFVIGLPTLLIAITWLAIGSPNARISLPDKDYWLAPERRVATMAFLRSGLLGFGSMLVVFLCYAHWLVVLANQSRPARLANSWFIGGLVAFLVALLIWLRAFLGHFRQRT